MEYLRDYFYKINAASNATLIISAVGYEPQELNIGGETNVVAKLTLDVKGTLNEVTVTTGLGRQVDKRKVAIDVSSVSSKDIAKSATASLDQAIQGKVAGAQVLINSGEPGANADIVLRGYTNLGTSNPIILVDGIQVYSLNGLDQSNVEKIEVVKGAAGGTLYGAQGGNGVIQIFTKKGARNGKPSINFSTKMNIDNILNYKDLTANKHHFNTDAQGYILDATNTRVKPDAFGKWPDIQFPPDAPGLVNDKKYMEETYNHMKQAYTQAKTTNSNISISGGADKMDYSITGSFLRQENVVQNKLERANLGVNVGVEIFKRFTLRNTTQAILQKENLLSGSRFDMIQADKFVNFLLRNQYGELPNVISADAAKHNNPLAEFDWHNRTTRTNRYIQNIGLNYKFAKFAELDYKYGFDIWNTDENNYYKNQESERQNSFSWGGVRKGSIYNGYSRNNYQNSLASLFLRFDFAKDFGMTNFPLNSTTQVSYDWRKDQYHGYFAQGSELPSFPPYTISSSNTQSAGESSSTFITYGWLINQTFEWKNLAGAAFGLRSDYSSAFGGGSKPFNFPRGNVYVRPSQLFTSRIINEWKIRGAYGEAGVQPGAYDRQPVFNSGNFVGTGVFLSTQDVLRNANLNVQKTTELEVGTDLVLTPSFSKNWLNKISIAFSWWNKKSIDVINNAPSAPSSGSGGVIDNLVNLESKGIDLSLDFEVLKSKNISWDFGVRFGKAKTDVTQTYKGLPVPTDFFALVQGQPLGIFYGQYALTNVDQLMPNGSPYISTVNKANYSVTNYGIIANKLTNKAFISSSDDKVELGNPNPKFFTSFINTLTILKSINLSFQFDWFKGNKIYNVTKQWLYRDRRSFDFDNNVTIGGVSKPYVAFYNSLYNTIQPVSWFVEDGSFLRLRDLALSYSFPSSIIGKWAKSLSATISGRNLFTSTKYSGLDPEAVSSGPLTRGLDNFSFPNLKSIQFGLNVGF